MWRGDEGPSGGQAGARRTAAERRSHSQVVSLARGCTTRRGTPYAGGGAPTAARSAGAGRSGSRRRALRSVGASRGSARAAVTPGGRAFPRGCEARRALRAAPRAACARGPSRRRRLVGGWWWPWAATGWGWASSRRGRRGLLRRACRAARSSSTALGRRTARPPRPLALRLPPAGAAPTRWRTPRWEKSSARAPAASRAPRRRRTARPRRLRSRRPRCRSSWRRLRPPTRTPRYAPRSVLVQTFSRARRRARHSLAPALASRSPPRSPLSRRLARLLLTRCLDGACAPHPLFRRRS